MYLICPPETKENYLIVGDILDICEIFTQNFTMVVF